MPLSKSQAAAKIKFMDFLLSTTEKEMIVQGPPGCGKSYLVTDLVLEAQKQQKLLNLITGISGTLNVYYTATTNKAADALSEAIKKPVKTIHSLLGIRPVPNFTTGETKLQKTKNYQVVHNALVIIDEASGIGPTLLYMVRDSTRNCKVLYVGDRYQTTDVGTTTACVFEMPNPVPERTNGRPWPKPVKLQCDLELEASGRYDPNGPIALFGSQIRDTIDTGKFKDIFVDGKVIQHLDGPAFKQQCIDSMGPGSTVNAKLVCWSNTKVIQYNNFIRGTHTSSSIYEPGENLVTNKPIVTKQGEVFAATEKIVKVTDVETEVVDMHGVAGYWLTLNHAYRVFQAIDMMQVKIKLESLKVKRDWPMFFQLKDFYVDLRPSHAATAYKAQGSTYEHVLVDLTNIGACHIWQDVARMLNVAITRASSNVFLYGELPAKYRG